MNHRVDVAVVGAGMAGASLAAELSLTRSVLLIEGESQPGYHSTGRSAAFWAETYGGPLIQPLTAASGGFLARPPADFHPAGFLAPRGALTLARAESSGLLDRMATDFAGAGVRLDRMERPELEAIIPGLGLRWTAGLYEPSCRDIDVAGLHAAYLKLLRRRGGQLITNARVTGLEQAEGGWRIQTARGEVAAETLVNAAGAWADKIAELAGIPAIGIQPFRRTVAQLRVRPAAPAELPLVLDVEGTFYFKPESGGRLWLSPQDETPCPPSDCVVEPYDVALAIDRLEKVVDWQVERVEHSWAGLRSFAPDRLPVYGYERRAPGFFWFAGQGGFGIQTAPAAAKLGAALLLGSDPDPLVGAIDPTPYSPTRFAN